MVKCNKCLSRSSGISDIWHRHYRQFVLATLLQGSSVELSVVCFAIHKKSVAVSPAICGIATPHTTDRAIYCAEVRSEFMWTWGGVGVDGAATSTTTAAAAVNVTTNSMDNNSTEINTHILSDWINFPHFTKSEIALPCSQDSSLLLTLSQMTQSTACQLISLMYTSILSYHLHQALLRDPLCLVFPTIKQPSPSIASSPAPFIPLHVLGRTMPIVVKR